MTSQKQHPAEVPNWYTAGEISRSGDVGLVKEALKERGLLAKERSTYCKKSVFHYSELHMVGGIYYKIGLSVYDFLAGKTKFG